jgi:transcriptional regulator with PAS, ATPase and Fis domain
VDNFSAAQFVSYLNTLPEPRVVMRCDCTIIGANRAYLKHYNLDDETSVVGRRCYEVSHRIDRPCYEKGEACPLRNTLQSGQPSRVLHTHYTPVGEERVDILMTPIHNAQGEIDCLVEMINVLYSAKNSPMGELAGKSGAFGEMMQMVNRVARSPANVLLLGESGTGKELVARAIHKSSARAAGPLVAVDCSSMPDNLIESELFGYEKGAFSGAHNRKQGLVEAANGGTLFLDEVGDIPLGLQVKLLRLLETGTFRRVGGLESLHSDFRLVAATHRDFDRMVEEGKFRQDLYYRISTFPIMLPPLRERIEDLPLLIETLLKRISPDRSLSIHPTAMLCLSHYDFPGNIRELRNLLERASLLADGDVLLPEHFPQVCKLKNGELRSTRNFREIMTLEEMERSYIEWQVQNSGLGRDELAGRLGVSRRTLFRKLRKLQ